MQNAIIASIYEQNGVMTDTDDDLVLEDFSDDDF